MKVFLVREVIKIQALGASMSLLAIFILGQIGTYFRYDTCRYIVPPVLVCLWLYLCMSPYVCEPFKRGRTASKAIASDVIYVAKYDNNHF